MKSCSINLCLVISFVLCVACTSGGGAASTTSGSAAGSSSAAASAGSSTGRPAGSSSGTTGGRAATTSSGSASSSGPTSGSSSTSGTTTGPLEGYVYTLAGGDGYNRDCEDADGGVFSPITVAVGPGGSVYVAGLALFQIAADGGIIFMLDQATVESMMGGGDAESVATNSSGAVYVSPATQVFQLVGSVLSLFAGDPLPAGVCYDTRVDGGGGFANSLAMAADSTGNVFVGDQGLFETTTCTRIREATLDGVITTIAGNGGTGYADGPGPSAEFWNPAGLAVDKAGNIYVADRSNDRIRKVAPDGTTTTLAGNGNGGFDDGTGGPLGSATFNAPVGVAVDSEGFVYVADVLNNSIRQIAPDGTTTTLAGNGQGGFVDGTLGRNGTTQFAGPNSVAVNAQGDIFVADISNCRVRVIHRTQ
jgi:hypothetical protein